MSPRVSGAAVIAALFPEHAAALRGGDLAAAVALLRRHVALFACEEYGAARPARAAPRGSRPAERPGPATLRASVARSRRRRFGRRSDEPSPLVGRSTEAGTASNPRASLRAAVARLRRAPPRRGAAGLRARVPRGAGQG